jgi:hypothetical protein
MGFRLNRLVLSWFWRKIRLIRWVMVGREAVWGVRDGTREGGLVMMKDGELGGMGGDNISAVRVVRVLYRIDPRSCILSS